MYTFGFIQHNTGSHEIAAADEGETISIYVLWHAMQRVLVTSVYYQPEM